MTPEPERRYAELRASGNTLHGIAVQWGAEAAMPWGKERIDAGAFGDDVAALDVVLNLQHQRDRPLCRTGGGGLELRDANGGLEVRATLPDTQDGNDAALLVRRNVLRGLSVEFVCEADRHEGDTRIVERASLLGIALVDRPAYPRALVSARTLALQRQRRAKTVRTKGPFRY